MDVALYLVCQRYDLLLLKSLARSISFKMAMMHACPWFTFEAYVTKMPIYICRGLPNVCLCGCLTFQNPGKHVLLMNIESSFFSIQMCMSTYFFIILEQGPKAGSLAQSQSFAVDVLDFLPARLLLTFLSNERWAGTMLDLFKPIFRLQLAQELLLWKLFLQVNFAQGHHSKVKFVANSVIGPALL